MELPRVDSEKGICDYFLGFFFCEGEKEICGEV